MTQKPTNIAKLTPMMRQYYELKGRAGDAILFFRMGDFYEIFGDDAEHVAPILELVLTSRERGDQRKIPFCGVPHHSARNYYLRLLKKGYKVAIADQVEDPATAKGLVKRDIVRTMTPGCIDDLDGLVQESPNYLMAAHEDPDTMHWSVLVCDLSTGELRLGKAEDVREARDLVGRFRPRELLLRKFLHDQWKPLVADLTLDAGMIVGELPEAPLREGEPTILEEVFGVTDLTDQPCGQVPAGSQLVASVLTYLRDQQAGLKQFLAVRPLREKDVFDLTEAAMRDLELFETVRRRQADGSLFKEVNATISPMGARYLRYSLAHPLLNEKRVTARHDAVAELVELGELRLKEVREHLRHTPDLERLATRIFAGSASPAELHKARTMLEGADWLAQNILGPLQRPLFKKVGSALKTVNKPLKLLHKALCSEPGPLGKGTGVLAPGYDPELDRLSSLAADGQAEIDGYQQSLRDETGINSLKIKNHKTFGLLIEVTKSNLNKVPDHFVRRQTMVNNERFVTDELAALDQKLTSASDNAIAMEATLFGELLLALSEHRDALRSICQAFATFDLLQSFAWIATTKNYTRAKLSTDGKLALTGARHPVVERFVGRHEFTPNDLELSAKKKHALITGPNMAGKSTVMRQTAICAILNQIGSFVPARAAVMPLFDQIFTRVGAADDLSRGQSTFMVEMSEAATILRQASPQSLVILDEVGRGTSTQDGLAIASAILEQLAKQLDCYSLFATHYHELVGLAEDLPSVKIVQTEVLEQGDEIIFTHRLVPGASGSSFGIEVARLAGLPVAVLNRARQMLDAPIASAPVSSKDEQQETRAGANRAPTDDHSEWVDRFHRLNLDRLTPLQALNLLAEFQAAQRAPTQMSLFGTKRQDFSQDT